MKKYDDINDEFEIHSKMSLPFNEKFFPMAEYVLSYNSRELESDDDLDISKENVIGTFGTLAACVAGGLVTSEDGIAEVAAMISATGITIPALISFIAFNMTTIPCFAAVATTKGELTKKQFRGTLLFWLVTSYIVSMMINLIGTYWWTAFIFILIAIIGIFGIKFYNKYVAK
jgi:Ca2+/Na+ antiporter